MMSDGRFLRSRLTPATAIWPTVICAHEMLCVLFHGCANAADVDRRLSCLQLEPLPRQKAVDGPVSVDMLVDFELRVFQVSCSPISQNHQSD